MNNPVPLTPAEVPGDGYRLHGKSEKRIHLDPDGITIEWFRTTRPVVRAIFEDEAPERYAEVLEGVLEVGAIAYQRAGSRVDLEHLASEVAHLEAALGQAAESVQTRLATEVQGGLGSLAATIEGLVGPGGKLGSMLDPDAPGGIATGLTEAVRDVAGAERESLAKLLDPRSPTSPLAVVGEQLRSVGEGIERLRVDLAAERASASGRAEEAARGTAKGRSFEVELLGALRELAKAHGDLVEYVGDTAGIDGRKLGDVLVSLCPAELGGAEVKMVVEAKTGRTGLTQLRRDLAGARQRRGAVAGIGVYGSEEVMPSGAAPLTELSPVDLAVLYDPASGDREALRIAYRLARILALQATRTSEQGHVDAVGLRADLAEARDRVTAVCRLRAELTRLASAVTGGVEGIKARLADLGQELSSVLERMESRLSGPTPAGKLRQQANGSVARAMSTRAGTGGDFPVEEPTEVWVEEGR